MPKIIKPVILGPDGRPVARARDRLAPTPNVGAGLEGWVSWGLIDRKAREVQGGEQHNLILNGFLERIATGSVGLDAIETFLSHFAVGTGSTAPAVTDTALVSELARTTTQTQLSQLEGADGVWTLTLEREFGFAQGNGNLTEFGFSYGASSPMLVRELFRDSGGNPITVTKTSDYKLRIRYVLTVTLLPVTETSASFTITGIGAIGGTISWHGRGPTLPQTNLTLFGAVARGSGGARCTLSAQAPSGYAGALTFTGTDGGVFSMPGYVPGSHTRSSGPAAFGTSEGNVVNIASINVSTTAYSYRGAWAFIIDPNDRFTKDSLHTLTLNDILTVSWGRA